MLLASLQLKLASVIKASALHSHSLLEYKKKKKALRGVLLFSRKTKYCCSLEREFLCSHFHSYLQNPVLSQGSGFVFPSCRVQLGDRTDTCSLIQGLVRCQSHCAKLVLALGELGCQSVQKQLLGCVGSECCAVNSVEYKLNTKVCVCVFSPPKPTSSALPWLFLELSRV